MGDLIVDRYVFCDAIDVASEAPVMSLKQLHERVYYGGAAIVAQHLARLGAQVELCTSWGQDTYSRQTREILSCEGIGLFDAHPREKSVVKSRYLVEDKKLLKIEQADSQPPDMKAVKRVRDFILARGGEVDAVVFCDFGFGAINELLLKRLMPHLREKVRVISADVSGTRGNLLHFHEVDLFCPTEREMRSTLHNFDDGLSAVAWQLMFETRARHLMATLGQRGLVAFDRQSQNPDSRGYGGRLRSEYLQAFNDRAVDALGCGDALLAGATLGLCCGASFMQSAYLGNAMAALEAAELGNAPINLSQLRQFLNTRAEL